MKLKALVIFSIIALITAVGLAENEKWKVHDMNRPQPKVIAPGKTNNAPPSDAIILFDGKNLKNWQRDNGEKAAWKVKKGYMEVAKDKGSLMTKQKFGNCQLHIEWATPSVVKGDGQGRGNSGIFLMGQYEVQVLDSFVNTTYPDGQAASIYGQSPPLVNASRGPGIWQTYDIIFHRPIFDGDKVTKPATVTVLHNGVLVQDNWEIVGPTAHKKRVDYKPHADELPIMLQNHGNPVKYRNIWIRELPEKQ